ncbi:MAG: hypothetical protein IPM34_14440 [Saprospiraceae bacterium]|nr:hypothetical protein [Saprospiraceae bacterium]
MKKLNQLILFCCILATSGISQNVFTEDFMFGPVDSIEQSNNWYRSGVNSTFNIASVSPGLEYNGYVGSGRGNTCMVTNDGNGDFVLKQFSNAITSGAAYMSLMVRVDSLPATVTFGNLIGYNIAGGGTGINTTLILKRLSDSTFLFGTRKTLAVINYGKDTFSVGQTYLAVLKYSFVPGTMNDSSILYIFDQSLPLVEPDQPHVLAMDGNNDHAGQQSVAILNNYAENGLRGCNIKLDGIRVGTSWQTSVLAMLSSVSDPYNPSQLIMEISPNPSQEISKIKYQLPEKGFVSVQIFQQNGLLCETLVHSTQEKGIHAIEWNAGDLPTGTYVCKIQFKGQETCKQLVLVR